MTNHPKFTESHDSAARSVGYRLLRMATFVGLIMIFVHRRPRPNAAEYALFALVLMAHGAIVYLQGASRISGDISDPKK